MLLLLLLFITIFGVKSSLAKFTFTGVDRIERVGMGMSMVQFVVAAAAAADGVCIALEAKVEFLFLFLEGVAFKDERDLNSSN